MTTIEKEKLIKKPRSIGIYSEILITKQVYLNIVHIGSNIKQILEKKLASEIEGKCIVEGYIKEGSVKLLTYSSGIIKGEQIYFEVVLEALVCCPVEGMHINCIAENITKAGIKAQTDENPSPIVIFITRDHHHSSEYFSKVKVGDIIKVRVIGQRFELNDKYISIIAELLESREEKQKARKKPKLIIKN
jgi:DNA-directed RNA polymerase subunit E'/Rpb7